MKVIHLSTTHEGGAGLAARRLNEALNESGIDSVFYALAKNNYKPLTNEFQINRSIFRKILSAMSVWVQKFLTEKTLFSTLSSNAVPISYYSQFQGTEPVILHFHNWANLISAKNLEKLTSRGFRMVFTLHDQRLLTGGCHYTLDCEQFTSGCLKCPRANIVLHGFITRARSHCKFFLDTKNKNISLLAPSVWMAESTSRLELQGTKQVLHIPNVLGPTWLKSKYIYSPSNTSDQIVTIGIATNSQKSFVKVSELIQQLNVKSKQENTRYRFLFLTDAVFQDNHSMFWQQIDFLLALSRADNSPNVIAEAKSFGIPVIASDVGGIPELLNQEMDYLINQDDLNSAHLDSFLNSLQKIRPVHQRSLLTETIKKKENQTISNLVNTYQSLLAK